MWHLKRRWTRRYWSQRDQCHHLGLGTSLEASCTLSKLQTPALVENTIYVRTETFLYAFSSAN